MVAVARRDHDGSPKPGGLSRARPPSKRRMFEREPAEPRPDTKVPRTGCAADHRNATLKRYLHDLFASVPCSSAKLYLFLQALFAVAVHLDARIMHMH